MEGFEIIEQQAKSVYNRARELLVRSDEEYAVAGEFILGCKRLIADIKGKFKEPKEKAFAAHRAICQMETDAISPVEQALDGVGKVALDYKQEQDRLAKEEADRIEKQRLRQAEEQRLKEAEELKAKGKIEEAENVLSAPLEIPRPTRFFTPVPKVAGLSTKKEWKGKIVNSHLVDRRFCLPDQTLVNKYISSFFAYNSEPTEQQLDALKAEMAGIEIYPDEVFAGRRK